MWSATSPEGITSPQPCGQGTSRRGHSPAWAVTPSTHRSAPQPSGQEAGRLGHSDCSWKASAPSLGPMARPHQRHGCRRRGHSCARKGRPSEQCEAVTAVSRKVSQNALLPCGSQAQARCPQTRSRGGRERRGSSTRVACAASGVAPAPPPGSGCSGPRALGTTPPAQAKRRPRVTCAHRAGLMAPVCTCLRQAASPRAAERPAGRTLRRTRASTARAGGGTAARRGPLRPWPWATLHSLGRRWGRAL